VTPTKQEQEQEQEQEQVQQQRSRPSGPMMPTREQLAQAAATATAEGGSDDDDDDVGPALPPSDLAYDSDEMASLMPNDAKRVREVNRVIEVAQRSALKPQSDAKGALPPNWYDVLGVSRQQLTGVSDVRRAFRKASLLLHPDKCSHERAREAFELAKKANETLADEAARAAYDARLDDVKIRKMAVEDAARMTEAARWRILKGTSSSMDRNLVALAGAPPRVEPPQGMQRESWLTDDAGIMGSLFAQRSHDQPQATNALGRANFSQRASDVGPSRAQPVVVPSRESQPSMVEMHQRRMGQQQQQEQQQQRSPGDWEWRSWDRDNDLGSDRAAPDQRQRLRNEASLSSRFGRGSS